jgi:hypothetical protein
LRYSGRPDLELQSGNISSLAKHELATPSTLTGLLLTSNNQGPVSDGVEETVHALFDGHIRQLTVDSSPTGYGLFVLEDLLLELMDFLVFCVDCVSVSKIVVLEGVDLMIMSTDLGDEASLLLIQCVFAIGNISGITWDVSVLQEADRIGPEEFLPGRHPGWAKQSEMSYSLSVRGLSHKMDIGHGSIQPGWNQ